jgi:hypothetical protein
MYTIDIILRGNPLALSVQRKQEAGALALYQEILAAIRSGQARPLELTCEKMAEKRVAVLTSDIAAVQITPAKSGGTPLGVRAAGFFAGGDEE